MTATEIRNSYKEFQRRMDDLSKNIMAAVSDKRRQGELPLLSAQFQEVVQMKTLETWFEIAAQLAEMNAILADGLESMKVD